MAAQCRGPRQRTRPAARATRPSAAKRFDGQGRRRHANSRRGERSRHGRAASRQPAPAADDDDERRRRTARQGRRRCQRERGRLTAGQSIAAAGGRYCRQHPCRRVSPGAGCAAAAATAPVGSAAAATAPVGTAAIGEQTKVRVRAGQPGDGDADQDAAPAQDATQGPTDVAAGPQAKLAAGADPAVKPASDPSRMPRTP